ncbi:M23 family metallopeptidase [Desmospora activa]|uniref:Peptidase M23-like protein n=1 Tax=Desmospora activa DSM 45169 TaxID=1121389 RepID=A0A2T4Z999_9BACL|nr:M23 family metallopeptidase [Desmospora activa]PTM58445.1 peptidase M23-like protein [Desmospora activa DSM 45169]
MKSIFGKIAVVIVTLCLLSACGGLQKSQNKTPPQPTRQLTDRNAQPTQPYPIRNVPDTDQIFTKTEFILPIKETWYVFWGGTNKRDNYHYAYESQRYAIDLVIRKNGKSYRGDKKQNQSYYAFGKEVIAPAKGTVIQVENDVSDNKPVGKMNPDKPFGNYVMIDHGNDEYSVIGHLKKGSPVVNVGDTVEQGDLIGLCGNSGNSSEPHIHFQVSNSSMLNQGQSIRIRLRDNVNPTRGQYVQPATGI